MEYGNISDRAMNEHTLYTDFTSEKILLLLLLLCLLIKNNNLSY